MPKKDINAAVLGMLSNAGAETRRPADTEPAPTVADEAADTSAETAAESVHASVSTLPSPERRATEAADKAPRTLRLRPNTAGRLRAAWLEAKRDDVLLTAQDFASDLVEEALGRRRRRAASSS